jgi:hypothetical protein
MYQREWQLLAQIDNLTKAVEHLKKVRQSTALQAARK